MHPKVASATLQAEARACDAQSLQREDGSSGVANSSCSGPNHPETAVSPREPPQSLYAARLAWAYTQKNRSTCRL